MKVVINGLAILALLLLSNCRTIEPTILAPHYALPVEAVHELPQPAKTEPALANALRGLDSVHAAAEAYQTVIFNPEKLAQLKRAEEALEQVADDNRYAVHRARLNRMRAWDLQNNNNYPESIIVLNSSLRELEAAKVQAQTDYYYEQSYHYNLLAIAHRTQDIDLEKAIYNFERSLDINLQNGLYAEAFKDYASLFEIYSSINNPYELENLANKAIEIEKEFGELFVTNNDLNSRALLQLHLGLLEVIHADALRRAGDKAAAYELLLLSFTYFERSRNLLKELPPYQQFGYMRHLDQIQASAVLPFSEYRAELIPLVDPLMNRLVEIYPAYSTNVESQLMRVTHLNYLGSFKEQYSGDFFDNSYEELIEQLLETGNVATMSQELSYQIEALRRLAEFEYYAYRQSNQIDHLNLAEEAISRSLIYVDSLALRLDNEISQEYSSFQNYPVTNTALLIRQLLPRYQKDSARANLVLGLSDRTKSKILNGRLSEKVNPEQNSFEPNALIRIEDVQNGLLSSSANSAAIDLYFGDAQVYVTTITQDKYHQEVITLTTHDRQIVKGYYYGDIFTSATQQDAYALYQRIFANSINWLNEQADISLIYLAADREFALLDFERLLTDPPSKGKFWNEEKLLIDQFSISQVYSLSSALHLRKIQQRKKTIPLKWGVFGATGAYPNPSGDDELIALKAYEKFADKFLTQFSDFTDFDLKMDCLAKDFLKEVSSHDVITILAHGGQKPLFPDQFYLQFLPDPTNPSGKVAMNTLGQLQLTSSLVVSLACESGDGPHFSFEGKKNIAREFIAAGSLAVIAGEGSQYEAETVEVMENFYRNWVQEGMNTTAALRQAKISYRKAHPKGEPQRWSGLIYLGMDLNPILVKP